MKNETPEEKRIPTTTRPQIISHGPIGRFETVEAIHSPSARAQVEGGEALEATDGFDVWSVSSL